VSTHLVETSVLTRYSRPQIAAVLAPLADKGVLARCTLSDLEIGFSASNAREWDDRVPWLDRFEAIDVTPALINRAKIVQRSLADQGLKGRKVPDLIIAAAAELAGLTLLHYDYDFELIASVTGQRHTWIVPRGTVD